MTLELEALARRAVACKNWRWMPGMRSLPTEGMVAFPLRLTDDLDWPHDLGLRLPDLSDPATLGCLLALVRERWGSHAMTMTNGFEEPHEVWSLHDGRLEDLNYGHQVCSGSSEAEVLVKALEVE